MMFKRFLATILSLIMMIVMHGGVALAKTSAADEEKNVFDILNIADSRVTTRQAGNEVTYTITNPDIIAQMSDSEDLPYKIELTYIPAKETTEDQISTTRLFNSYELRNVRDKGDGWYNPSVDQLYEFYIDGPDRFIFDKTDSFTSSTTCSVAAAIDVISAGVGFTIGNKHDLHIQSNTPVPSRKRLHVEIFRTHHKVTFDLYKKPWGGSWSKYGNYEAIKPNGTFIKKEFWNI